jgi:endonuclease/exonuclease/phosphatase family metal-dependent hydrolase
MRSRRLLAAALLLGWIVSPAFAGPSAQPNNRKTVAVMTRNLYLGSDLTAAVAAIVTGDPTQIIAAVTTVWAHVVATDFPKRAEGLADEVAQAQPDLIGLQEAVLWRSQTPPDFDPAPNANHVEYDFIQILLDALEKKGLHYEVVAISTEFDAEFPGIIPGKGLSDIRLTDRDVILARADAKTSELKLSNIQTGHFVTNVVFPIPGGFFTLLRGWASVDAKVRGETFHFVTTHLESDVPPVRAAQAIELVTGPANTKLPVLLAGDFNSDADGSVSPEAYGILLGAHFLDAWRETHPGDTSRTCCNNELLTNSDPFPEDFGRIDLVLFRGSFTPLDAERFGEKLSTSVPPLWPSDHAGVAATLQIR